MPLIEIAPADLQENPFDLIGKRWMLITAGSEDGFNSMTASWGGMGSLWNKNVAFTFIRPERYTYTFAEKSDLFSLTFFEESYREQLYIMGNASGRDIDKVAQCGFTPVFSDGCPYYREASLVFICKKIYFNDLKTENMSPLGKTVYSNGAGIHRMYIGEIVRALRKV
ncbi:MAG: flavin reductase family protein [Clostridiales bacterium]|jgi:flavin reductase (DIM6/NTAB) family NADH-FMN oxidoreductase RutF|nr:flavin reductase family protein [Clostridiales bacterium]